MIKLNNIRILNLCADPVGINTTLRMSQFGAEVKTNLDFNDLEVVVYNHNNSPWSRVNISEIEFREEYPHLILAEYSTFGSHTIWCEKEGDDAMAQAMSGITHLNGDRDDAPKVAAIQLGSVFCASYLVQGILSALYCGTTKKVSTSMLEALVAIQTEMITTSQNSGGRIPMRAAKGNAHPYLSAPYGIYRVKDGYFAMSITPIPRLAEVMEVGIEEAMKPRKGWFTYRDELMALFAKKFLTKTNQEWLDIFEPLDIWCGRVLSLDEILEHEGYKTLKLDSKESPYRVQVDKDERSTIKSVTPGEKPLNGVVVVDLSQFLSAPSATLQLVDLGAQVIKVERPISGESGRDIIFDYTYLDNESSEFLAINRGKLGYAADLKKSEDMDRVLRLIKGADVLIHNFRPAVIKRLGLDYNSIKKLNPQIIYADISGYGDSGCWVSKPGQDLIVQALSGITTLNSETPTPIGAAIVDLIAGAHLVEGVLAALNKCKEEACSAHIQVTMIGSVMNIIPHRSTDYNGEFWDWNDLIRSEYGESLNMLQEVSRSNGYKYKTTRCPIRFDGKILTSSQGAPTVGEHNKYIDKKP